MTDEPLRFRDPTSLTAWTLRLLYGHVLVSAVAVGSGMLEYQLLTELDSGVAAAQDWTAAAEASDDRQGIVGLLQVAFFFASGVLILMWIYRANDNAHRLGAAGMAFTPGWAVGWYFIPFANLWKPYQAMKEIWRASASPMDPGSQAVPSLLPWWWFFWIASNLFANATFRLALNAEELDEMIRANVLAQIADAAEIPLGLLLIAIIRRVHEMQVSRARPM